MIAKGNVTIGLETRFGPDWPGVRCGAVAGLPGARAAVPRTATRAGDVFVSVPFFVAHRFLGPEGVGDVWYHTPVWPLECETLGPRSLLIRVAQCAPGPGESPMVG